MKKNILLLMTFFFAQSHALCDKEEEQAFEFTLEAKNAEVLRQGVEIAALKKENEAKDVEIAALTKDKDEEIAALTKDKDVEIAKLEESLKHLRKRVDNAERSKNSIELDANVLRGEKANLKEMRDRLLQNIKDANEKIVEKDAKIKELEKKIKDLETKMNNDFMERVRATAKANGNFSTLNSNAPLDLAWKGVQSLKDRFW